MLSTIKPAIRKKQKQNCNRQTRKNQMVVITGGRQFSIKFWSTDPIINGTLPVVNLILSNRIRRSITLNTSFRSQPKTSLPLPNKLRLFGERYRTMNFIRDVAKKNAIGVISSRRMTWQLNAIL